MQWLNLFTLKKETRDKKAKAKFSWIHRPYLSQLLIRMNFPSFNIAKSLTLKGDDKWSGLCTIFGELCGSSSSLWRAINHDVLPGREENLGHSERSFELFTRSLDSNQKMFPSLVSCSWTANASIRSETCFLISFRASRKTVSNCSSRASSDLHFALALACNLTANIEIWQTINVDSWSSLKLNSKSRVNL